MAGLADDWPENRQACVDVLCTYLRLPYEPAPGQDAPGPEQLVFQASREVRHTVIRVITAHLKDDAAVSWQGLNFDFTGVVFDCGDFRGARFSGGTASFDGAVFSGGEVIFKAGGLSRPAGTWPLTQRSPTIPGQERVTARTHGRKPDVLRGLLLALPHDFDEVSYNAMVAKARREVQGYYGADPNA